MPRKPRKPVPKRRQPSKKIPQWQLDFLLSGEEPSPELGFEGFCWSTPSKGYRHESWRETWQTIKNLDVVKKYRRRHGKPWAEELIEHEKRSSRRAVDWGCD